MEQEDQKRSQGEKDYSNLSDDNQNSLNNDTSQWNNASAVRGDDGYNPASLNNAENKSAKQSNELNEDNLSKTENDAANNSSWDNNTGQGGTHASRAKAENAKNLTGKLKGKGPTGALIGALGGGTIIVSLLSSIMMMLSPVHFVKTFTDGFANMRNPMMTVGTQKTVGSKLTSNYSSGICKSSLSVKCKFKTASDKTIQKLTDNGVKVNTDGKAAFSGRNVVTSFEIDGKTISTPQEMSKILNTDTSARSKMDLSFKTRLMNFADARFTNLLNKIGFNKNPFKDWDQTTGDKIDDFADVVKNKMNAQFDNFKNTKLGGAVSGVADSSVVKKAKKALAGVNTPIEVYCGMNAFAGAISTGVKMTRAAATMTFALSFFSLVHKMMAGDGVQEEMKYVGEALSGETSLTTAVDEDGGAPSVYNYEEKDSDGNIIDTKSDNIATSVAETPSEFKEVNVEGAEKSALDSQIYSWYAYNDVSPGLDSSASKFVVGMGAAALISNFTADALGILNPGGAVGDFIKGNCRVINSTAYDIWDTFKGVGENLTGVGLIKNIAFTVGIGLVVSGAMKVGIDILKNKVIPDDIAGQDLGNALSVGAGEMMSQNAQTGGGSLLTKDGAIAYHQETQRVLAMQAEEDRLNLSPFDPTSKNTFLGSIVFAALPLASSGGLLSTLGAMGNITSRSFASILPGASAVDDAKFRSGLSSCPDDFYDEYGIAAGPDCVIMRGVDVDTLNSDPDEIFDFLINEGQISEDLSSDSASLEDAIISDTNLEKYKKYCSDRETPIGSDVSDGGFFGLGAPAEGWNNGSFCLYNPSGSDEQKNANYYSAFMNLVAAEDSLDAEPDESPQNTGSGESGQSLSGNTTATGDWAMPLTGNIQVTSEMGERWGSFHNGIDLISDNLDLLAVDGGEVVMSEFHASYGNVVFIKHGDKYAGYAHMRDTPLVRVGDKVEKGQKIGTMGTTGDSTGVHLHFNVSTSPPHSPNENFINPRNVLDFTSISGGT